MTQGGQALMDWLALRRIGEPRAPTEAALMNADRDAVYAPSKRNQIRAGMKKLGLDP